MAEDIVSGRVTKANAIARSHIPLREIFRDLASQEDWTEAEIARVLLSMKIPEMDVVCPVDIKEIEPCQRLRVRLPRYETKAFLQSVAEGEPLAEQQSSIDLWREKGGWGLVDDPVLLESLQRSGCGERFSGSIPFSEFEVAKDEFIAVAELRLDQIPARWLFGDSYESPKEKQDSAKTPPRSVTRQERKSDLLEWILSIRDQLIKDTPNGVVEFLVAHNAIDPEHALPGIPNCSNLYLGVNGRGQDGIHWTNSTGGPQFIRPLSLKTYFKDIQRSN